MAVLKKGSRGKSVTGLQLLLNSKLKPSPRLKPDGAFGKRTGAAVERFQKASGLTPDGIVGPDTWRALGQQTKAVPAETAQLEGPPWYDVALGEYQLGVRQIRGEDKHNDRILQYHATSKNLGKWARNRDETAWCSSFVNWCMIQAGYRGTDHALAKSWLDWGTKLERPRKGAVTVIFDTKKKQSAATGSTRT